ncbi:MAG: FABP family protein [Ruaniaceae bacterium]|nr:FABP family protein [Ruaniaceae bacterium]
MSFALHADTAPELYPISWLLGTWHGFGVLGYVSIPERSILNEMTFEHDGGPYLRATSTIWEVDGDPVREVSHDTPGSDGYAAFRKGTLWSTETQYWRPVESHTTDGATRVELEVLAADPAGHLSLYVGAAQGPRIDLATDAVIAAPSSAELSGGTLMYGLVASDLLWVKELAAFGHSLGTYASARLSRVETR